MNSVIKFFKKDPINFLSYVCFFLGILCIPCSAFMMLAYFPKDYSELSLQNLAIFVGLWASVLVSISNFLKNR